MGKIEEARAFLQAIGMPKAQQNDLCCLSLLALAGIEENMPWKKATDQWMRIHDIIVFCNNSYGVSYAENTRETIRKQAMHNFRNAAIVEDNGKPTNSPNYRYRLTMEALEALKSLGTRNEEYVIQRFISYHGKLTDIYASRKKIFKMPVRINTEEYQFSPGKHSELQIAVLKEFAPRFAPGSECLYVGDTIEKDLVRNTNRLQQLGFDITPKEKMPDIVLYREDKNWLYFVEAVTSVGPMDPKRMLEISQMTKGVNAGKIFVTAFLDFQTYKKFSESLAWETEVWIAELPDHLIHLDGERLLTPRTPFKNTL